MASSAKLSSLSLILLIITLLSSLHTRARDSHAFNKVSNVVPNTKDEPSNNQQQQESPDFVPQNENPYGLYGQDMSHLPHSTTTATGEPATTTTPYNAASYATEPDVHINDSTDKISFTTKYPTKNYYNGEQNYYNGQQEVQEESPYRSYPTRQNNNYYYNGGRSRGSATFRGRDNNGFDQPQGMSDTRSLENGKYFYNVYTEKYSNNHPYERLRRVRARNEYNNMNNYYANDEYVPYEFNGENSMGGYQNQDEFQDIEDNNMP